MTEPLSMPEGFKTNHKGSKTCKAAPRPQASLLFIVKYNNYEQRPYNHCSCCRPFERRQTKNFRLPDRHAPAAWPGTCTNRLSRCRAVSAARESGGKHSFPLRAVSRLAGACRAPRPLEAQPQHSRHGHPFPKQLHAHRAEVGKPLQQPHEPHDRHRREGTRPLLLGRERRMAVCQQCTSREQEEQSGHRRCQYDTNRAGVHALPAALRRADFAGYRHGLAGRNRSAATRLPRPQ